MINRTFFEKLKSGYDKSEKERRQIISQANNVLHDSKRIIFALHRNDFKKATTSLEEIENILITLGKTFGYIRLNQEGAYKAGVEEYVEAKMFYLVLTGKQVNELPILVKF